MKDSKSKFVKVVCSRCGNEQVVFGKASIKVKCLKCNKLLLKNSGGKSRIMTFVRRVLNGNS